MGLKGLLPLKDCAGPATALAAGFVLHLRRPLASRAYCGCGSPSCAAGVVVFAADPRGDRDGFATPGPRFHDPPPGPPKPAFTRAEEAYIQALWPIHGEVERSAVRMSLGNIFYKIKDMGKAESKDESR